MLTAAMPHLDDTRAAQGRDEPSPGVVAAARRGDRDAFATLIRHYDGAMRDLAYRLLGDRVLMDDVLQSAYLRAFRGIGRFRGDAAVGTWLYRITYNACLDARGREEKTKVVPLDDRPDWCDDALPDSAEQIALRLALTEALSTLSLEHRAAVVLVDQEGFDYRSAAELLNVPPGTLSSRLTYARSALRAALADTLGAKETS